MESDGPYSTGDSVGLVFKDGRGVEDFDSERDKLNACRLANTAWSQGRASRDGLREASQWALEFFKARDEMNAKVHCSPIRLSPITERFMKALEADGEGK